PRLRSAGLGLLRDGGLVRVRGRQVWRLHADRRAPPAAQGSRRRPRDLDRLGRVQLPRTDRDRGEEAVAHRASAADGHPAAPPGATSVGGGEPSPPLAAPASPRRAWRGGRRRAGRRRPPSLSPLPLISVAHEGKLPRMLPGCATPEGTARFRDASGAALGHFRQAAGSLWLSSLGIGTYLGRDDAATDARYAASVRRALQLGLNVVDTAINYRNQRSERAVGAALRESGEGRDGVVVCTKGGYLAFDGGRPY